VALLGSLAPKWCSKLRLWREAKDQRPIRIDDPGALKATVIDAATERGSTYQELVERHGRPPLERVMGSAELRGAGSELVVVVSIDEMVLSPLKRDLGSDIALQARSSRRS
jgi:hypothetical protein